MLWLLILFINIFISVLSFNLDVDHPIIIQNPDDFQNNTYFGYAVVLYSEGEHQEKWFKIGAPKATYYDSRLQKRIQQSGVVYHCPYMKKCKADTNLGYGSDHIFDEITNLTGALTGGSLDISYKYKTLAISAPGWEYFMSHEHTPIIRGGIFLENFQNKTLQKRSPLKDPLWTRKKKRNDRQFSYYSRAQAGFSLHFLPDKNELLIGAPGVYNNLGTIIEIKNAEKMESEWQYKVMSPGGNYHEYLVNIFDTEITALFGSDATTSIIGADGQALLHLLKILVQDGSPQKLKGYAITSGCFCKKQELYYVVGLPRGQTRQDESENIIYGSVLVFTFSNESLNIENQYKTQTKAEFYGTQFGEYFGASLAAGDLNGDNLDDLIVGAPFRTNDKSGFNHGSVYVIYGHKKMLKQDSKNRIDGSVTNGLFGLALMFLGNMDNDRYGEFAVSAPQEDISGVVYICTYDVITNRLLVSQRILGKDVYSGLRGFGMSFSRPNDIDDNHFSDILIGSPISGHAVLLRSKPIVHVDTKISAETAISTSNNTLSFKCCYSYIDYQDSTITIIRDLAVDIDLRRFSFKETSNMHLDEKEIILQKRKRFCENLHVFKVPGVDNYNDSISITLSYRFPENKTANTKNPILICPGKQIEKDTFCKKCPVRSRKEVKSVTKLVMWDNLCGGQKCVSQLITHAKFGNLSKENTFVLGSYDHLPLEVTVSNVGDPAFMPSLEIYLPYGVYLKRGPINHCGNIAVDKIICNLGEQLINNVTYSYEFNIDEGLSETKLEFLFNSSTMTPSIDEQSRLNYTLILERDVDFEITGESKESIYVYTKKEATVIRNIFKIENMGISPMPEIEVHITVPNKMIDSQGIYRTIVELQEYVDKNDVNQLPKCQNFTDYEEITTRRARWARNLTHPEKPNFHQNGTHPMFDPINIFYINCTMENIKCIRIKCLVGPFDHNQKYAEVAIEMKVNLTYFEDMLKPKESVFITWKANLSIENFSQSGNRSDFAEVSNLLIIEKEYQISLWILIGSAIVGFIILICLSTGLAKTGFFERKNQKKLMQLREEALEEEHILEQMIEAELRKENCLAELKESHENEFYGLIRNRDTARKLYEENAPHGASFDTKTVFLRC